MFHFFRRKSHRAIRMEDDKYEDLSVIDNTAIVERVWTRHTELSNAIYFNQNCLHIGHLKIPVEYIMCIDVYGGFVRLSTCVEIMGNIVVKVDKVSHINIRFVHSSDANAFRATAYNCMIDCKYSGEYDHGIFRLNIIRKIFSRKSLS